MQLRDPQTGQLGYQPPDKSAVEAKANRAGRVLHLSVAKRDEPTKEGGRRLLGFACGCARYGTRYGFGPTPLAALKAALAALPAGTQIGVISGVPWPSGTASELLAMLEAKS
jgi:hypothetical protein